MKDNKIPSPLVSLLPVFVLILLLFVTIRTFGSDALSGGSQVCLLVATAVCVLIGMAGFRRPWKDFELAVTNNIAGVSTALIILLIIGALSGAWMVSGVVPTLIYYGIQVIHPHFFLVSTCIICAVVSVMTGSSWTTIATIGIALMGIGKAQGFSEGWIAGAIISGAYFGDKVSPLSDTTILASSVTDTPLFTHIRYLMITTVPSLVITLIIFTIAGLSHEATDTGHIAEYTRILSDKFHISWWLMIVPVVTAILIARKVPSIITLFVSTALATVFALIFQPGLLCEIAGQGVEGIAALFKGGMGMLYGGTQLETGNAEINELISTRGMASVHLRRLLRGWRRHCRRIRRAVPGNLHTEPFRLGYDEYHLADYLRHVFRRGDDSRRNARQYHFCLCTFYEKAGRNGVIHSCIGLVPESCYSRSIYIHYPDG